MPFEIIPPGTHFDFIGKWRVAIAIPVIIILAGLAAIPIRGLHFGIDFAGGTEVLMRFAEGSAVEEGGIREVAAAAGVEDATVVRFRETGAPIFSLYFAGAPGEKAERVDALQRALAERFGSATVDRVEFVGPRVGAELRRDGVYSLLIAFVLILAYVSFRFSPRYAPGAVVALVHDVSVTASIFVILGWELDLGVLAALLTIIGYSVNDTIVIFDRIRETMQVRTKSDLTEVINLSLNQTLSRTILTATTVLVAVLALLLFGGEVLWSFSMAMAIGVVVGTYSSIYIAAALLLVLETRFGGGGTGAPARPR
jgi:preprotein translocase subunit SecF